MDCTSFFSPSHVRDGFLVDGQIALVLRVLYRLRALSEQAPFDSATVSFAYLLLGYVARKAGVNILARGAGRQRRGARVGRQVSSERISLSLSLLRINRVGPRSSMTVPTIPTLQEALRQPGDRSVTSLQAPRATMSVSRGFSGPEKTIPEFLIHRCAMSGRRWRSTRKHSRPSSLWLVMPLACD